MAVGVTIPIGVFDLFASPSFIMIALLASAIVVVGRLKFSFGFGNGFVRSNSRIAASMNALLGTMADG